MTSRGAHRIITIVNGFCFYAGKEIAVHGIINATRPLLREPVSGKMCNNCDDCMSDAADFQGTTIIKLVVLVAKAKTPFRCRWQ